jgi:hypothetical protein
MNRALLAIAVLGIGCFGEPEQFEPTCLRGKGPCRSRDDVTRTVTVDSAGQLQITAGQVWPDLATQPKLPAPMELAKACLKLSGCTQFPLADCLNAKESEENGVPYGATNERVLFLVLEALKPGVECAALKKLETLRPPGIVCESHGCEWVSNTDPVPTVTCNGTVATLAARSGTFQRDCSHAFAKCDPQSPTGCTDRPLIKCPPTAIDRCDGDVQLGCRMIGYVSFRNCALYGGRCEPTGLNGNATCEYAKTCTATPTCSGSMIKVCAAGETVDVDCKSLGFAGCFGGKCQ